MGRGVLGEIWWDIVGNHMRILEGEEPRALTRGKGWGRAAGGGLVKSKRTEETQ